MSDFEDEFMLTRVRFFGEPWPNRDRRAPVCEDDRYLVEPDQVVGKRCMDCSGLITETDRGVITACSRSIFGFWDLPVHDPKLGDVLVPVCAYHLLCWMESVVGGEMSEKIAHRMRLRPGDVPLSADEIDRMEANGPVSLVEEEAEPGRGWNREEDG